VQLGYGVHQRRLLDGHTDRTSALATYVAEDPELTRTLLHAVGVPVPEGRVVSSADDAWEAAEECELPVIVRPRSHLFDRAFHKPLATREQVTGAFQSLTDEHTVVVEKYLPGRLHRLLLIGGNVAAALRDDFDPTLNGWAGDPASLNGSASHGEHKSAWSEVTERVHAETATQAAEAARVVGLNLAEVHLVVGDISRPMEAQCGAIIAVHARPDLGGYLHPARGQARPIGQAMVDHIFPDGTTGRIPIVAITGVNGKTTTTRLMAHIFTQWGKRIGMTCTDGIFIGSRRIDDGDCSGPQSARMVLQNPQVEAAAFETARGGILREGLGFDRCDVAVVTNIGSGDHLGMNEVDTPEQLARVKATIVDVVPESGTAVLNARDPLVVQMKERCKGAVVFFAPSPDDPVVTAHRQAGGRAVFVRQGQLMIAEGERETTVMPVDEVPLTGGGKIGFQVENVLAAMAAAWRLGIPLDVVRAGLASFASTMDQAPGRFNLFEIRGATVIVDYGHNASALAALIETLATFPHERRVAVWSTAGDRRDVDMIEQGELLGNAFDRVFLYEDHYRRGRAPGEIIALFRQGLSRGSRTGQVDDVEGAINAVQAALAALQAGDLLLVQADVIDETVAFLRRYLAEGHPGREIHLNRLLEPSRQRCRHTTTPASEGDRAVQV
jgi:cyanophycin synthetase